MRIAKPILLVSTPIGVVWGVVVAYQFHHWLAALMIAMLSVVSTFIGYTVQVIRREQRRDRELQQSSTHEHREQL